MRGFLKRGAFAVLLLATPSSLMAQEPAVGSEVSAEDDKAYEELISQAEELFQANAYDDAAALLDRAYGLRRNSNILYNIARIYEQKGDLERALEYYDRFIVAPNVDLNYRREALERSTTIREILKASDDQQSKAVATQPEPVVAEPVAEPVAESSGWRTAGIVMAVVGGASVVGGSVFGVLALNEDDTRKSATDLAAARDAGDRADLYAALADGMIIGGAAIGLTGLIIALVSGNTSDSTVSLSPIFVPGGAGAAWTVEF